MVFVIVPLRSHMQFRKVLAFLIFTLVLTLGTASGQSLLPHKDMVFAQVAVGESIETQITLTNRGPAPYTGTLFLTKNQAEEWNVKVNGIELTKGEAPIYLAPGSTYTWKITGARLEAGFAVLAGSTMAQTNFVEGHLTYFVKNGSKVLDSVGISESTEFYFASLPFEDFSSIGLALANTNDRQDNTDVSITLFSENGDRLATTNIALGPFWHRAVFLKELFPQVNVGRGRVEIQSKIAISGTALCVVDGQMSSLPLVPSIRSYSLRATAADGTSFSGEASLWAEGFYVKGYLVITELGAASIKPETHLVYGRLVDGVLRLSFYGKSKVFQEREVSVYAMYRNFSFAASSLSCSYVVTYLNENATSGGTFVLTKTN